MTEATAAKFCMQVEYVKCLGFNDRLLPNGRGQTHVPVFINSAPVISLESMKVMHFKFRVLLDT